MPNIPAPGDRETSCKQPSLSDLVLAAQVQQLYSQAQPAILGSLAGAAVLTFALWEVVSHWRLLLWLGALVIAYVLRHVLVVAFRKANPEGAEAISWGRWFAYGTVPAGILWGMSALILFPSDSVPHQSLLSIFVAGISCAAVVAYWPLKATYAPTILAELVPFAGRFFYEGDTTQLMIGGVILVYVAILIMMANHLNLSNKNSLMLGFEKQGLLASLETARLGLETRVEERTGELTKANASLQEEIKSRELLELELRYSEEKYRLIVENTQDVIYQTDMDGRLTFASPSSVRLLGYRPERFVGRRLAELYVSPDERTHLLKLLMEDGSVNDFEAEAMRPDGSRVWLSTNARLLRDEKGNPTGVAGVARDITHRKKAEEALRESEQRLSQIIDFLPDATMAVDSEGRVIAWNRAIEEMTGVPAQEMMGKGNYEYAMPFYGTRRPVLLDLVLTPNEEIQQIYSLFKTDRGVLTVEAENATPLGKNAILWARATPLYDTQGTIMGAIETIRDITERRKAEEALRESEERLRLAWETTPDAFSISRLKDGTYVDVNNGYTVLTGYSREEVLDKSATDLPFWHDPSSRQPFVSCLERDGQVNNFEAKVRRKDGEIRTVWISAGLMTLNGEPHLLAVTRDVEESYKAAEALRASEEKYRNIFENIAEGVFQTTPDGLLIGANPALARMFGYESPDEMISHVNDLARQLYAKPEDREDFKRRFDDRVAVEGYEVERRRKDGTHIWVSINARSVRDESGKILYYEGTIEDITSRRNAEQALQRSESLLKEAQRVAHIGHWEMDLATNTFRWSEELFHIYGLDPARGEPSLDAYQELIHPNDWDSLRASATKAATQEIPFDIEFRCIRPDKSIRWINTKGYPTGKREGKFFGMFGTSQDITERKRAEDARRLSEEKYRLLVDKAPIGICSVDKDGRILEVNQKLLQMLGSPSADATKALNVLSFEPLVAAGVSEVLSNCLLKGTDQSAEIPYTSKWGKTLCLRMLVTPLLDESNDVRGCQAVMEDVSERKKAEQALLESEERYRQITENSLTGIFVYQDGQGVYANRRLAEMGGYTPEEVLSIPFLEVIHPDDRHMVKEMAKARLAGQPVPNHYELRLLHKDGYTVWSEVIAHRIEYEGRPAILGSVANVTQRRILEDQLRQAQKMEAIGTLAGGIAHDFNNLLTVVQGFSELLLAERDSKDPECADLQKIVHAAKSGAALVQQLLMFSRKSEPKPVPMSLNKQIVQIEKLLRRTIHRMVDINLDLSSDLPKINADPSQIEQVIMNLAVNARDAMPDVGKMTVKTSTATLDEEYCRLHIGANPGEYVLLEISDTGHGMDKETLEHIFEPFFTTKEIGRGTGLGLAMVYGIVAQHNGHIYVYSEVGKGTIFRVYLPAIAAEVEPEIGDSGIMPAFGTETILLVDDEELLRELGARILTKQGYTVLQAGNGSEALTLFKKECSHISLVILDLIMPKMGGTECLKGLMKIDPNVKVLVSSGFSADAAVRETVQMGAKGFVSKPFRVKELIRDVRKVLDES